MKKFFLLVIFFNFFYNCCAYSIESYVVLKINNKIITNVDIDNEYRYLIALSTELQNVGKETVMELAKNSIIREKIKQEELMKHYDLSVKNKFIDQIISDFFKKLGMKNINEFKNYLSKYNLYLFYGENEGYKNEIIKNKFEILYTNQIYKYDEKEILESKNEFFNSILTKSFFEDKKLIIISRVSDKIKDIIEEITFKNIVDVTIVLSTNVLEKKSKLRNFFEKEKNTICIPFYADTNQILTNISLNFFKQNKISISQHTINLIVERSRGNRENLNNELEKINNYSKFGKKISTEDILKLTNLSENYNVSELTNNCLAKNIKKTAHILNENNFNSEDCILIIRTLLIKAKRLLKLQEEVKDNKNIEQVVTSFKPPIFWKDKDIVKQQINNWSLEKIKKMIININKTELLIKKNSINSLNILSDFILTQSKKLNN